MSGAYRFLVETYASERLKTLGVWSMLRDEDLDARPAPLARTPLEHMVHQCVSEDTWMRGMFGVAVAAGALPASETRLEFLRHYAAVSAEREAALAARPASWWEESIAFFDVQRPRSWAFLRRLTHSAHHRGQLTLLLRLLGRPLHSTYGPSADTGGLPGNGARTIYRAPTIEALLETEASSGPWPPLPGPGEKSATERPERSRPI